MRTKLGPELRFLGTMSCPNQRAYPVGLGGGVGEGQQGHGSLLEGQGETVNASVSHGVPWVTEPMGTHVFPWSWGNFPEAMPLFPPWSALPWGACD